MNYSALTQLLQSFETMSKYDLMAYLIILLLFIILGVAIWRGKASKDELDARISKLEKFTKRELGKFIKSAEEDMQNIINKEISALDKKWEKKLRKTHHV